MTTFLNIFKHILLLLLLLASFMYANSCPKFFPMPHSAGLHIVVPIYNPTITRADFDCDGLIDSLDPDIDNDGILNTNDPNDYNPNIPSKATLALNKIKAYASSNGTSTIPSVQDYVDVGVTGITPSNLVTMNQLVANLTQNNVDTQSKLQVLANNVSQNKHWRDTLEISKNLNSENISSLHSSIDTDGNAIVVWQERFKSTLEQFTFFSSTKVSSYNASANTWTNLTDLETGSHNNQTNDSHKLSNVQPNIAMNSSGDAIAVWVNYGDYYNTPRKYDLNLRVKHYDATSNQWGASLTLSQQSTSQLNDRGVIIKPKIVLSDDGSAFIVWIGRTGALSNYHVYSLHYSPAQGWDTIPQKHSNIAYVFSNEGPIIAIHNNGDAMIVWSETNTTTTPRLFASHYNSSSALWSAKEKISPQNIFNSSHPQILFDSLGNTIVVWIGSSPNAIWSRRYNFSTASWGTTLKLTTSTAEPIRPRISIDNSDNIIATWIQIDITNDLLISTRYSSASDSWSSPITTVDMHSRSLYGHQLTMDTQGNAMLIWRSSRINEFSFTPYAKLFKPNTGWDVNITAIESENNQGDSFGEQILSDENGNFIAIWSDKKTTRVNGTTKRIYSIRATHYK